MPETIVHAESIGDNGLTWVTINKDHSRGLLTYEMWLGPPQEQDSELIGYVDPLYTSLERNKYIATFEMTKHADQHPVDAYFFDLTEARDFIESSYMAWRMVGKLESEYEPE